MSRSFSLSLSWLCLSICFLAPVAASAQLPADFNVNSVADKVDASPGDGVCSTGTTVDGVTPECTLRAAIDEVNALSPSNLVKNYIISVQPGTYLLTTSETCTYAAANDHIPQTIVTMTLCLLGNMTLRGTDATTTIVDAGRVGQVFYVSYPQVASIENLTIQNGVLSGRYEGGGLDNEGTLTLSGDIFKLNQSDSGGGAAFNNGTMIVDGCTFIGNAGDALGAYFGTISVNLSLFQQNQGYQGAAIDAYEGTLQVSNSTFTGNTVSENGIIMVYGTTTSIVNSTLSNNTVGNAGVITGDGNYLSIYLDNDTISGNVAGNGIAGLFGPDFTIANSIVYGNTPYDCALSSPINLGHNIFGQAASPYDCPTGSTTLNNADPKLGQLEVDGGILPTQNPLAGSPAIGGGSTSTPGGNASGACTAIDERGIARGNGSACTIGAAEALVGLQVENILPATGVSGGTGIVTVRGNGFSQGSTLALKLTGQPDITPLQTTVSLDTTAIAAVLDLSKATAGTYDVVVTTPVGSTTELKAAYTVQQSGSPNLYSYLVGNPGAHAGTSSYYSVIYGNRGNQDAYLVPLTLSLPGNFTGLIISNFQRPPAAPGQVTKDWTYVPVEVDPYSTTGFFNVPLILPVIPAGTEGTVAFTLTPPSTARHGDTYSINANLGEPYGVAPSGALDPTTLSDFVTGAQGYAQSYLGVTLSNADLTKMSSYAAAQFAQIVAFDNAAILSTADSRPASFSTAQLSYDTATYGASLETGTAASTQSRTARRSAQGYQPEDSRLSPGPSGCSGAVLAPGTSGGGMNCDPGIPQGVPGQKPPPPGTIYRGDCRADPHHHVSADGKTCVPDDPKGCALIQNPFYTDPDCGKWPIVESIDPNEKDGPLGVGDSHFTLASDSFAYQVEFENSASASAPAQTVVVTDPLDTSKVDLSTFELGQITFGSNHLNPLPGQTTYSAAMDLRPASNVIVSVAANLNKSSGIVTWRFTSLDPGTMQLTTDPFAGFLPPDVTPPQGIGRLAFKVKPLASVASGAQICNTASIVFDANPAIATSPFCNSKDTAPPVSSVAALPPNEVSPTFTVSWSGTDAGVGVAYYTIYVSEDGGPFSLWQSMTASTSASYTGVNGHTYGFYSIATDLLGNTEAVKTTPEASTTVGTITKPVTVNPVFNVRAGTYTSAQTITISDSTPGAVIYYTIDGSMPTTSSPVYSKALTVKATETISAIALATGDTQSAVTSATYTITLPNDCYTVDYSRGFTTAGLTLNGSAKVVGGALQLTDGKPGETSSAFYSLALPITPFVADYTFNLLNPDAEGITFVIQADSQHALGTGDGGLGYAGIPRSAAIKFDLNDNAGEGSNSTGAYVNGAMPTQPSDTLVGTGLDLHSGHIFHLHLVYDGKVSTFTLTDTVTDATASKQIDQGLSKLLGTAVAFFGFTGSNGAASSTEQILTWMYNGGAGCTQNP